MPTFIIENMPEALLERIQRLAQMRHQQAAETGVEMLEGAFRSVTTPAGPRLPQEPFLTEDTCAPCSIPRSAGQPVHPVELADYVPGQHNAPDPV